MKGSNQFQKSADLSYVQMGWMQLHEYLQNAIVEIRSGKTWIAQMLQIRYILFMDLIKHGGCYLRTVRVLHLEVHPVYSTHSRNLELLAHTDLATHLPLKADVLPNSDIDVAGS